MKDWQFCFICGSLAYISSKVCTTSWISIIFAISGIIFYIGLIVDIIKEFRGGKNE